METVSDVYLWISIISIIFSLIVFIRWWGMTSDIKDIRNYLINKNKSSEPHDNSWLDNSINKIHEDENEIDKLKIKLKPDQCIVRVNANKRLEIWDRKTWDEHVQEGRAKYFEFIYKNY